MASGGGLTTSSDGKFEKLCALGVDHVLNYVTVREWGQAVRELTGGDGVDRVVETFGPDTIEQSMRASALHGQIVLLITRSVRKAVIEISGAVGGVPGDRSSGFATSMRTFSTRSFALTDCSTVGDTAP